MSIDPDKKLAKIRRVLHKAEHPSCPPAEAEALTAMAAAMLARYGLDAARLAEASPGSDKVIDRTVLIERPYALEKVHLLGAVARALRAQIVYRRRYEAPDYEKQTTATLFGYSADLNRIELLYTSLLVQGAHAVAVTEVPSWDQPAAFRRTWWLGFARTVGARLAAAERESVSAATTAAPESDRRLPVILAERSAAAEAAMREACPRIVNAKSRLLSGSGQDAGSDAARRADLGSTSRVAPAPTRAIGRR